MQRFLPLVAVALAAGLLPASATAGQIVEVTVHGTVEFNVINPLPLGAVADNEPATLRFRVDSDVFQNSAQFPTRGYAIDKASFTLTFDSAAVTLKSPFPAGATPYFVLRNNDPAVDGFYISTDVNGPVGLPLSVNGSFGAFAHSFLVTYGGSALPSLDILDALGTWDYAGLQVFHFSVDDGPFEPMGLIFESMTIATVGSAWTDQGNALAGIAGDPKFVGSGTLAAGSGNTLALSLAKRNSVGGLFYGVAGGLVPFKGGTLVPFPFFGPITLPTSGTGTITLPFTMPAGVPAGTTLFLQWAIQDAAAVQGVSLSNALLGVAP